MEKELSTKETPKPIDVFPKRNVPLDVCCKIFEDMDSASRFDYMRVSRAWRDFLRTRFQEWKYRVLFKFRNEIREGKFLFVPRSLIRWIVKDLTKEDLGWIVGFAEIDGILNKAKRILDLKDTQLSSDVLWKCANKILDQLEEKLKISSKAYASLSEILGSKLYQSKFEGYIFVACENLGRLLIEKPAHLNDICLSSDRPCLNHALDVIEWERSLKQMAKDYEIGLIRVSLIVYCIRWDKMNPFLYAEFIRLIENRAYPLAVLSALKLSKRVFEAILKSSVWESSLFFSLERVQQFVRENQMWDAIARQVNLENIPMEWIPKAKLESLCQNKKTDLKFLANQIRYHPSQSSIEGRISFQLLMTDHPDSFAPGFIHYWTKSEETKQDPSALMEEDLLSLHDEEEETGGFSDQEMEDFE